MRGIKPFTVAKPRQLGSGQDSVRADAMRSSSFINGKSYPRFV